MMHEYLMFSMLFTTSVTITSNTSQQYTYIQRWRSGKPEHHRPLDRSARQNRCAFYLFFLFYYCFFIFFYFILLFLGLVFNGFLCRFSMVLLIVFWFLSLQCFFTFYLFFITIVYFYIHIVHFIHQKHFLYFFLNMFSCLVFDAHCTFFIYETFCIHV